MQTLRKQLRDLGRCSADNDRCYSTRKLNAAVIAFSATRPRPDKRSVPRGRLDPPALGPSGCVAETIGVP